MELKEYKQEITRIFAGNRKNGFVEWHRTRSLLSDTISSLETAKDELCAQKRYEDLFSLACWTYIKWGNTDKDDSGGETSEFCACIYSIWERIYEEGMERLSHDRMLEKFLKLLEGKVRDYMEDTVYDFILGRFKNEKQLARKDAFLLKVMEDLRQKMKENSTYKYSLYVKEDYYAGLMAERKRPIEEIRDFLCSRDRYGNKMLLAGIEADYGNWDEAAALYRAHIAERPAPYWSDEARKLLMEILKAKGDREGYNSELYEMMMIHPETDRYFREYKALFKEEAWSRQWEKLLEHYAGKYRMIVSWLNNESRYDLIMDSAEPDHLEIVDEFENKLFELYPERCLKVLENYADLRADNAGKRSDYRSLARFLKSLSSRQGGGNLASELAEKYRKKYPNRPAMLEELEGI
jgi:hypothetical protein